MKIKALSNNFRMPVYATSGAAAFDIRTPSNVEVGKIPTKIELGFAAQVPEGYVAVIAPRSGHGFAYGVNLRNTVGIIDSDYRGEWCCSLSIDKFNTELESLRFSIGDRILQCMILPVSQVEFELVDELTETERDKGGFGHTGNK